MNSKKIRIGILATLVVIVGLILAAGGNLGAIGFHDDPGNGGSGGGDCPPSCNYCCEESCGCSPAPPGYFLTYGCGCSPVDCWRSCNHHPIPRP